MRQNSSPQTTERKYTIKHQGVPIGVIALPPHADRVTVAVDPLPAYDAPQHDGLRNAGLRGRLIFHLLRTKL